MFTLPTMLLVSAVHFAPEPDPVLAAALVAPMPALVEADKPGFSYTYIEGNYVLLDSDFVDDDLDGFELTGSLELPLNFFLQATGATLGGDVDLDELKIGAGWHIGLADTIDAYGILSWINHDYSDGVDSEDGIEGEAGARLMLGAKVEVNGFGQWADVEDDEVGFGAGARYYLTEGLSLGARALLIDSGDEYTAGLRFQF